MAEGGNFVPQDNPAATLKACLATLESFDLDHALPHVDLDVLDFLSAGVRVARLMLDLEATSHRLKDLPLRDPEALEDATIVKDSTFRATERMAMALNLLCAWLQGTFADGEAMQAKFREHLHAFNNLLVGINCYADLLRAELQPGDPCYDDLTIICEKSAAISTITRQRALIRRYLNELAGSENKEACSLRRKILILLAESLGIQAAIDDEGGVTVRSSEVAHTLATLPLIEQKVLGEILRRLESASHC